MRRLTALSILILLTISTFTFGQSNPCVEAKKIVSLMNREHIEPIGLNDTLSARIFNLILNSLDPKRLYFTESDIKKLDHKHYLLDDEIKHGHCHFITDITSIYKNRLESSIDYLLKQKTHSLDTNNHSIYKTYEKDEFVFPDNETLRFKRIKDRITLKTLYRLEYDYYNDSLTTFPLEAFAFIDEVKDKVIDKWICQINHILNHEDGFEKHISEEFLTAITKSYDPHSAYFNERKKKEFDLHLSRESETFGLYVEETDNGEFMISDLSPGGPAWKSNLIHEEDILTGISWPINNQNEDIICATEADINNLLNTSSNNKITLHIKKIDGKTTNVTLEKEVLRVDENTIKSFVIHGDKNIGYLTIPSFYSEEGGPIVQGCANDVAKEVIKLKREHIDGLILDLRHNGGGSLKEAIDFAGIFIDEGPICLMKEKNSGMQIVKDFNRGRIYEGPLVVLINTFSASASEILASSLQDYNRAVIVGSKSYGKATGQVIIPIDTVYNNFDELIGSTHFSNKTYSGYIKLTNSKFYRVNNTSNQKNGMTPDIPLPSIWDGYHFMEKNQKFALKNDLSDKQIDFKKYPELPLKELIIRSQNRAKESDKMQELQQIVNDFENSKRTTYPLNPSDFWTTTTPELRLINNFTSASKSENQLITVKNNESDAIFIEMDELINSINNQLIEDLEHDIFINETYSIISDLIDLTNSK